MNQSSSKNMLYKNKRRKDEKKRVLMTSPITDTIQFVYTVQLYVMIVSCTAYLITTYRTVHCVSCTALFNQYKYSSIQLLHIGITAYSATT